MAAGMIKRHARLW